jgi:predicted DNA-binding transcriptional regulator AlpA
MATPSSGTRDRRVPSGDLAAANVGLRQFAASLGVCTRTIRVMVKKRPPGFPLPLRLPGGHFRWSAADVDGYIAYLRRTGAGPENSTGLQGT